MRQYILILSLIGALAIPKDSITKSETIRKAENRPFHIYGFIAYGGYMQGGRKINTSFNALQKYLLPIGIKKLNLIYEGRLLDYPDGDKKNGIPDSDQIYRLAKEATYERDIPVSLDLEGWNRFDIEKTPQRLIAVINAFKKVNNISPVGLYATVPQNTYGYSAGIHKYDKVNNDYAEVAASVDYFSPSLYNYNGTDTAAWNKAAVYNIEACRKYKFPSKKILPYITPEFKEKGVSGFLSYDEMMNHLQTLYKLGADGCLIWTSSQTRDAYGNKIYIDVYSGWAKAVKDFSDSHP